MSDQQESGTDELRVDIQRLLQLLPHRYPFLLVDRLEDIRHGVSATGIKNVTFNEPHFQGHFPGQPVMPGVLIIEAMAQTAIALVMNSPGIETEGKIALFTSIDKARFRRPVVPGDILEMKIELVKARGPLWKFHGAASVSGDLAAEADYAAMAVESEV